MFRTEELSETCRVSCQNKLVNLVHLVGFIIKKFAKVTYPKPAECCGSHRTHPSNPYQLCLAITICPFNRDAPLKNFYAFVRFPKLFQYLSQYLINSITKTLLHRPQTPDQTNSQIKIHTYTNPLTFTKRKVHVVRSVSLCLIAESLWFEFFWIREVLRISVQPQYRNHHLNALFHDEVCLGDRVVLVT